MKIVLSIICCCIQLFAVHATGTWCPQIESAPIVAQQEMVRSDRVYDSYKRNTLVSSDGVVYMNNMYPPIREDYRQLLDILVDKGYMSQQDKENVEKSQSFQLRKGVRVSDIVDSLGRFLSGVVCYLEAFEGTEEEVDIICSIMDPYLCISRNYYALDNIRKMLCDKQIMEPVWKWMHTEKLLLFDKYVDRESKTWLSTDTPIRLVSHLDMCKGCEREMFEDLNRVTTTGNYSGQPYKILVGSFCPYKDSRNRNAPGTLLLKAALQ